jgi:hypothetical protein
VKRVTKRVLLVLLFVGGLGYFLFSTLFFDPFEGSWMDQFEGEPPIALEFAVPREIDFLAHKRGLGNDFGPGDFPVPQLFEELRFAKSFQRFETTRLAADLARDLDLEARIDAVREAVARVPLIDVVDDVLGRDIAIFGRVAGFGYEQSEMGALFLGSSKLRFAWAVAGSSLLRSIFSLPIEVEEDADGVRAITLPSGDVLYALRRLDLFCVATGRQLVREVATQLDAGREGSLGNTRAYNSTVAQDVADFAGRVQRGGAAPSGPPVETRIQLHGRVPPLLAQTESDEAFLEPRGEMSRWLLAKLFNPRFFQAVSLDIGFAEDLVLNGTLGFDRKMAEEAQTGFYNRRTFELKRAMDRAAAVLPEETFLLMAARVDMKLFLPQVIAGLKELDPYAVTLIDDLIASIRKIRPDFRAVNAAEAVNLVASFLGDDVVVAMRRDTYFGVPADPTPLVCFLFEVTERGPTFDELKRSNGDPTKTRGYNGFVHPIMMAHTNLRAKGGGSVATWFNVYYETQGSPEERVMQDVFLAATENLRNVAFGIVDPARKDKGPWQLCLVLSPRAEKKEVTPANGAARVEDFGTAQEFVADIVKLHALSDGGTREATRQLVVSDNLNGNTRNVKQLLAADKYASGSAFLDGFASVAAFLDAKGLREVLADHASAHADAATAIDWAKEGERLAEELYAGPFAAYRGTTMPAKIKDDFEYQLAQRKEERERQRVEVEMPRAREQYLEGLAFVDLFEQAFLAARIDEGDQIIELRAKVGTTLE